MARLDAPDGGGGRGPKGDGGATWIKQEMPAFLAEKSTSSGGRPPLVNEKQMAKFKEEVGKRALEGRGYTLKSGEFVEDLRKYVRATLKDLVMCCGIREPYLCVIK